jgi:hypothetical protein
MFMTFEGSQHVFGLHCNAFGICNNDFGFLPHPFPFGISNISKYSGFYKTLASVTITICQNNLQIVDISKFVVTLVRCEYGLD